MAQAKEDESAPMNSTPVKEKSLVLSAIEEAGLDRKPADWPARLDRYDISDVKRELAKPNAPYSIRRAETFLSPAAAELLEDMAAQAVKTTRRRFGMAMNMYAPLYVSNYCINSCRYCGFNCTHHDERTRLTIDEAVEEAKIIASEGFGDILLVSGEDPKYVNTEYMCELTRRLRGMFSSVGIEIHVQSEESYRAMFEAGVDSVTIYQETYDRDLYESYHPAGPKADYAARLVGQEAAARAGMRRLGLGSLLGLNDWRYEALALTVHAHTLVKHFWRSKVSFSFPRIRPAEGVDREMFPHIISDPDLTQMALMFRLCFPDAGLVLSTRESAEFRNHFIHLGITQVSAGSKTNPGGYSEEGDSTPQFDVSDTRSAEEVAQYLKENGYDPVWKDWDTGFQGA